MKIAFIVGYFPLISEGFILNQIAGLLDRGHEVHIYAEKAPPGSSAKVHSKVHPIVEKYRLLDRTYYCPSIPPNKTLRAFKGLGLLLANFDRSFACLPLINGFKYGRPASSLILFYRAIPFLRDGVYDIIHCQFGMYGNHGVLMRDCGIIKGKIVTTFRGHDITQFVRERGDHVYDRLFEEGDFFLANCEFFRSQAIKVGCNEDKIVVNGSGIDCSKFTFTPRYFPPDGRVRIATTGRLVEKKGIEYCIRAVSKLAQVKPNIEYNIIGDGPLMEDFQNLIQELGISQIVNLLGSKPQPEIIKVLDRSHIFVAPSITSANGDQDAPINTLKEAMAMGLPVISTYHGGIPELVEDGVSGFLVSERNADDIADRLNYLIEHSESWPEMGKAGRARVEEKYDMNKLNDELVEIYQKLL